MEKQFKKITNIDFTTFYNDEYKKLHWWLKSQIKGNEINVEDLCNDAFIILLKKIESFDPSKASLKTFLYAIAKGEMIEKFRSVKKKPKLVYVDYIFDECFLIVDEDKVDEIQYNNMLLFIKELDKDYNNIFSMKIEGMKISEIAKVVDNNESYVKNILYTAPKKHKYKKWYNLVYTCLYKIY